MEYDLFLTSKLTGSRVGETCWENSHDSQIELQGDPLSPLILDNVGSGGDEASSEEGGMEQGKKLVLDNMAESLNPQPRSLPCLYTACYMTH